jgi:hypothetical protein
MEYIVTLVETTRHIVMVEADNKILARASAIQGWCEGDLLDDQPRLLDLDAVQIDEVPMEDVA